MKIWLLHPAEPVPSDGDVRLFRYGTLSKMIAERGGEAVQWASTFNHFNKTQRTGRPLSSTVQPGYQVELLPARGYEKHVSWQRIRSQRDVASEFRKRSRQLPRPDVMLVSLPTLEMATAALEYAREFRVPAVVDVRDLWPDLFLTAFPQWLQSVGRLLLHGYFRQAQAICRQATVLTAVSQAYLNWGLAKAGRPERAGDRVVPLAYRPKVLTQHERLLCSANWEPRGITGRRTLRCVFFGTLNESSALPEIGMLARRVMERGHSDIEFVVCGKGPREAEFRSSIEGLPNIRYLGWVAASDLAWLMERSDVGLAFYRQGAFQTLPNKPIEYLAGGLAVLSTLPGEMEDWLKQYHCGATCAPTDIDGMADWLIRMKTDTSYREQQHRHSRQLFHEQFHAANVYHQWIDCLQQIGTGSVAKAQRAA